MAEDRRRTPTRRKADIRGIRYRLIAYLVVVVAGVVGFLRLEEQDNRIEREAKLRTYELCISQNQAREGFRLFIDELIGDSTSPQAQNLHDLTEKRFKNEPCPPQP